MTTQTDETTAAPETDRPDPPEHIERWTFGGVRMTSDRKRAALWIDGDGRQLLFGAKGGRTAYAIGMIYAVRVVRDDNRVSMIGSPEYTGDQNPDAEHRLRLAADARVAETRLTAISMERRHVDELDAALEPLLAMARRMRAVDRTALLAYVIRKIGQVW